MLWKNLSRVQEIGSLRKQSVWASLRRGPMITDLKEVRVNPAVSLHLRGRSTCRRRTRSKAPQQKCESWRLPAPRPARLLLVPSHGGWLPSGLEGARVRLVGSIYSAEIILS